jgi:hypothetical protein
MARSKATKAELVKTEKTFYVAHLCKTLSEMFEQLGYEQVEEERKKLIEEINNIMLEVDDIIVQYLNVDFEFELT